MSFEHLMMHTGTFAESQNDFGSLSIELSDDFEDLGVSSESPHEWTVEPEIRLVVQREKPYKIKEPSPEWLNLFGFTPAQVTDRAMRICHGPQTNVKAITELITNAEQNLPSVDVTFYTNSGDELTLTVSARSHEDDALCTLVMEDGSSRKPEESKPRVAKMLLSPVAPHNVLRVNKQFLKYFQVLEADVLEQGASAIFCYRTEGTRWRNLISSALAGGHSESVMATNQGDGTARHTTVSISGKFDKFGHDVSELEVRFTDAPASGLTAWTIQDGSSSSFSSCNSETETRTEAQRIAAGAAARTPSAADRGVLTHLKAMKAARRKRMEEEGLTEAVSSPSVSLCSN